LDDDSIYVEADLQKLLVVSLMISTGKLLLAAFLIMATAAESFKDSQLKFPRVKGAFEEKTVAVTDLFKSLNTTAGGKLFIRAFKKEEALEVWVQRDDQYQLLVTYPFCTTSGTLGPKRREGDLQIPEGIYYINHFNPYSTFHLSLGINYPNASDKILGDKHPGGAIYIHGNCVSIGCIPITDDKIKELYVMAVEAKDAGQEKIPVHIFPARLDIGTPESLVEEYHASSATAALWKNLQTIYLDFKSTQRLKKVSIDEKGQYHF
jgi:murein L,D-transpeptidase YafK